MTTTTPTASRGAPQRDVLQAAVLAFAGLLLRDLRVLTRERVRFLIRTVSQPLLLVFVFTYVFPRIGQGIRGPAGDVGFTTILVPGVLAIAVLIKGLQAVALPLVQEFGYTGEIEDRAMAPLPVAGVALEKVVAGAAQGLIGALIVLPIVAVVPAEPADVTVAWPHLVAVALLSALAASALGLALGTMIEPRQVPMMFSVVILPVTFLGATYYPWAALEPIPWLQYGSLINPLVYMSEGFRLALTPQLPRMSAWGIYAGLVLFTVCVGWLGVAGFRRRVLS